MFFTKRTPWHEEENQLEYLFVYGTLSFSEILSAAVGRKIEKKDYQPAALHGFKRLAVKDARFPVIRKCEGCWVEGFFVHPVTREELERLDDWEGNLYERTQVQIGTEAGETLDAWVFADIHHKAPVLDKDWCPQEFAKTTKAVRD